MKTWADGYRVARPGGGSSGKVVDSENQFFTAAQAVKERPVRESFALGHVAPHCRPEFVFDFPVVILKLCANLDYQSCETPDWKTTKARALLEQIKDEAIRQLPGYEDAPWGLLDLPMTCK